MAAVATKKDPFPIFKFYNCTKVSWHVTWCLSDPETPITKIVHCLGERTKLLPWTIQLLPRLGLVFRVKKPTIPLTITIN